MVKRDFRRSRVGAHQLEPETLMLGFGFDPSLSEGAVKTPIFLTSTFAYKTCAEGKLLFDYMSGRSPAPQGADAGLIYTRFNNPNLQIVEERLAVLERADACSVFSSGMAAILTAMLAVADPGQVVLRSRPLYGGTETLFDTLLAKLGIASASFIDGVDPVAVRAAAAEAMAKGPLAAIYVETPANPTNAVVDLDLMAAIAEEAAERQGARPADHRRQHPAGAALPVAPGSRRRPGGLFPDQIRRRPQRPDRRVRGRVRRPDEEGPIPAQPDRQPARRAQRLDADPVAGDPAPAHGQGVRQRQGGGSMAEGSARRGALGLSGRFAARVA